jgi:hypothetical protein
MPDYNAGRAKGEILITSDTRGAEEAQAAMAATAAEAQALDKTMGHVNETFDKNRQSNIVTAEQIVRHRGQLEELRKTYLRYYDDIARATQRREQIEQRYEEQTRRAEERRDRAFQKAREYVQKEEYDLERARKLDEQYERYKEQAENARLRGSIAIQNAHNAEQRVIERSNIAYERYQSRLHAVTLEVQRFNQAHLEATTGIARFRGEAERTGRALEQLSDKLSGIAKMLGTTGLYGLFGASAAGSLGLMGAGGLQGLVVGLGAVVEMVKDFSGAMLLLPAGVNAAALSLGTLAVGFHGVGQAISSMGDPKAFVESLRDLSPAARSFVLNIQQFTYAMRGAREMVQESLFQPIINDIAPLIQTWLPQLMRAGQQIANQFGQAFHQVFAFFQQPAVQQGFNIFVTNLVNGFSIARKVIEPFLSAWNTLAQVGSGAFPRIAEAIANVAQEFNKWVQSAAQSGQLERLINNALDGFTKLGHILRDIGIGIFNFFDVGARTGADFLSTIERLAAEFRAWVESAKGQQQIANFFTLLKQSAEAAAPILKLFGEGISIIAGTLTRLGIAIQPGLVSFFTSLVQALRDLGPNLQQMAPALNEFLDAFGKALLSIVKDLGPQLPQMFKTLADAFVEIMRHLPGLVHDFANLLSHLTSKEVETIFGFVVAVKALTVALAAMDVVLDANPVAILIVAIAVLAAGLVYLITHWDKVKEKVGEVTSKFGGLHGILDEVKRKWDELTTTVSNWWNTVTSTISGAWDSVVGSLENLKNKIVEKWNSIDWTNLGKNIIKSMVDGILDATGLSSLDRALDIVGNKIKDFLHTNSPAKQGPLHDTSPDQMGENLSVNYARGIESGTGAIGAASSQVANAGAEGLSGGLGPTGAGTGGGGGGGGGTAGFGGVYSSAGTTGISGKGAVSGFDQWISFITSDIEAWLNIAQQGWQLFQDVQNIVLKTTQLIADVWNNGNNPLTQPGGFFGPPAAANQRQIPGVPNVPIPGKPPDPWAGHLPGYPESGGKQTPVPGVPSVGPAGVPYGGNIPAPAAAASGAPAAGATAGPSGQIVVGRQPTGAPVVIPDNPSKQDIVNAIVGEGRRRGMSDDQIAGALAVAQGESNFHREGFMGFTPKTTDTGYTGGAPWANDFNRGLQRFMDNYQIGGYGSFGPRAQDVFDANGNVKDWSQLGQFLQGRIQGAPEATNPGFGTRLSQYAQAARQNIPAGPPPPVGAQGGQIPGAATNLTTRASSMGGYNANYTPETLAAAGIKPLFQKTTPDAAGGADIPDWAKKLAASFNLSVTDHPDVTLHGGVGQMGSWAMDFSGAPADQDRFAQFIMDNLSPQTLQLIHQSTITGKKYGIAGGQQVAVPGAPEYYTTPGGSFADESTMVHWATDVTPILPGINAPVAPPPATSQGGNKPGSPSDIISRAGKAGIHLPSSNGLLIGAGLAAAGVLGGGYVAGSRLFNAGSGWWNRSVFNQYDAAAKLDIIRSLSPEDIARLGITSPEDITFGGADTLGGLRGLTANIGLPPDVLAYRAGSQFGLGELARQPRVPITPRAAELASQIGEWPRFLPGEATPAQGSGIIPGSNIPRPPIAPAGPGLIGRAISGAGNIVTAAGIPLMINQAGEVVQGRPAGGMTGAMAITAPVILGGAGLAAAGATVGVAPALAAASGLFGLSTAFGAASAQPGIVDNRTPGVIYGPDGRTVISAGPRRGAPSSPVWPQIFGGVTPTAQELPLPAPGQPTLGGGINAQRERRGEAPIQGPFPVQVTNTQEFPGGNRAPQGPAPQPTTAPGAQAAPYVGADGKTHYPANFVGPIAADAVRDQGGIVGGAKQAVAAGAVGGAAQGPFSADTRSPFDKFSSAMSGVATLVGDGFEIFHDIVDNIKATADITDKLVVGVKDTEGIVGIIRDVQSYIKTAADIAKTVSDATSFAGSLIPSGGGADMGATAAAQEALQIVSMISGIISASLQATNEAISIGIDVYHEVGKYAGFIFGSILGGSLGTLGGNVRMLLNTRSGEIYAYSDDNPLNKNTIKTPFANAYTKGPAIQNQNNQLNLYTGPGQSPMQMMQNSMWMVSTGAPQVASVAAGSD